MKIIIKLLNNASLKDFLEKYGQISFCSVISTNANKPEMIPTTENPSPETAEVEKIGLVIFENKEEAIVAIRDLNGKIIDSSLKPLIINL